MQVVELEPGRADPDAWDALGRAARVPNPFFERAVVVPAQHRLAPGGALSLVVARDGSGWLAALPVLRAGRWRGVPVPNRSAWMHPYALLGEPLAVPGPAGDEALEHLLRRVRRATGFVGLEQLAGEGAGLAAAGRVGASVEWHRYERAVAWRRPDGDYAAAAMSSSRRGKLRRVRRQLEEREGALTVTEEPDAAELVLELEAGGWKGTGGTAMSTAGHGAFFTDMCAALAAQERLLLVVLRAGGRPVAATANVLGGHCLFGFRTAFDESLRHHSPGILILLETLERFHARPELTLFDGCGDPANETLNRMLTDRRAIVSLLLSGGGALGRAGGLAAAALKASRDRRAG